MMTVDTLREQISSLRKLMLAAGASSTAQDNVDALSTTLEPFREMSIAEFSAFLAAAQEYRTTGKVSFVAPAKSGRARTPKAPKIDVAEAVPRYIGELESLYAVVHE